jgi:hypothetical protein
MDPSPVSVISRHYRADDLAVQVADEKQVSAWRQRRSFACTLAADEAGKLIVMVGIAHGRRLWPVAVESKDECFSTQHPDGHRR